MNRRRLLQTAPAAALGAVWFGEARAQGTPVASPGALRTGLPSVYGDVAEQYGALAARLLEQGRSAIDTLMSGEVEALFGQFAPAMQSAVSTDVLAGLLPRFTTNRAQFEVSEIGLIYAAQVTGDTMTGTVQSGGLFPFSLQRQGTPVAAAIAGTPAPTAVLAGDWSGSTQIPDGTELAMELTFASDGRSGTVSIPEQNALDLPLTNITYRSEQPIGERLDEGAVPLSPVNQFYWSQYDWGDRGLTIDVGIDGSGAITGMRLSPAWQLPPDPADGLPARSPLQLPFDGLWWVLWGGDSVSENYHASNRQQRHASDIMIWNDGATWHDDPSKNENYWVWGQTVLAPADGIVVTVVDGIESNVPGALPTDPGDIAGNHVVLQLGEAAYLYLAHMQAGTIAVTEGDTITAGMPIGLAGNSGNSSEPHLHIHAQNEPDILSPTAIGLPITFANVLVNGEPETDAKLEQGSFVAPG